MVINLFFLSAVFALSCVGLPLFWYRGKRFVLVQVGICVLEVSLLWFLMKFTDLPPKKKEEEEEEEEILQIVLSTCNCNKLRIIC